MTVYFIGAGPGASDLITLRGLRLLESCPLCIYAGSLVPLALLESLEAEVELLDSTTMVLDDIIAAIEAAHAKGWDVARLHSGDPSLYGAIAEQMRRLSSLDIAYEVCPGVPSYAALAARLKCELTLPEITQSVVLTRTAVRASGMPAGETLEQFAGSGATLAIHLSINNLAQVVRRLTPYYGGDCPVVVGYRVSHPDELILRGRLNNIRSLVKSAGITRTALILVSKSLSSHKNFTDSRLYDANHEHALRKKTKI